MATSNGAAQATTGEQPHLKRVLSLWDLVYYGIILTSPIAAVPLFGGGAAWPRAQSIAGAVFTCPPCHVRLSHLPKSPRRTVDPCAADASGYEHRTPTRTIIASSGERSVSTRAVPPCRIRSPRGRLRRPPRLHLVVRPTAVASGGAGSQVAATTGGVKMRVASSLSIS